MRFGQITFVFIVILFGTLISTSTVYAQEKQIQLSLITPIQIFPESTLIKGLRINVFYGRTASVRGVDLGLVNHTTTGVSKGWQWGLAGLVQGDFRGFQDNVVNITEGKFVGFQSGFYNHAVDMHGFQLGFINYARSGRGLRSA